jgi:outer membrane protein TolC
MNHVRAALVVASVLCVTSCTTTGTNNSASHCGDESACTAYATSPSSTSDAPFPPNAFASVVQAAPETQAAAARLAAATADIDKANAQRMPTAALEGQAGLRQSDRSPFVNEPDNPYSYALTVRIPLYQGGRDAAGIEVANATARAASYVSRDVSLSTTYQLSIALIEVQQQRDVLRILQKHERGLRALKTDVSSEQATGSASRVDVVDVERQLLSLSVQRRQAELSLARAEEPLLRLDPDRRLRIESLRQIGTKLPTDDAALLDLALMSNPKLGKTSAQMDVAEARVKQTESAYNPYVSLDLSAGLSGNESSYDRLVESKATVRLNVPIYTGGARPADVQARREEFSAATFDRDAARLGIRGALLSASGRADASRRMIEAARRERAAATQLLDGIQRERKLGERSVFDEVRAIADLANAEINEAIARSSLLAAEVTVAAEAGVLDHLLGVPSPAPHPVNPVQVSWLQ